MSSKAQMDRISARPDRVVFSFVVDSHPRFMYQGYHLARSILEHCPVGGKAIHVHVTSDVTAGTRAVFADLGCEVVEIERFGDGRHCNKIAQLSALASSDFDLAVLLDTDTMLLEDILPQLDCDAIIAKVVGFANPSLEALREIAHRAGVPKLPAIIPTDGVPGETFAANCNGGVYAIPAKFISTVARDWPHWSTWLLDNVEPLRREGKEAHVDQVAMWLTIAMNNLRWVSAPSNLNYHLNFSGEHRYYRSDLPICLIHYHDAINVVGLIEPDFALNEFETAAVAKANAQIARGFDNRVFWNFRYARYPERGSGFGSRDEPLYYKRSLLRAEGIEAAESVLDVGCGDLEVLRPFEFKNYLGLDSSEEAVNVARAVRPDLNFHLLVQNRQEVIPIAAFVLCFEVLIHQNTLEEYLQLIDFLARTTGEKLLVSGFDAHTPEFDANHALHYHEPLTVSLARTRRFRTIEEIGAHTSVKIYRCLV